MLQWHCSHVVVIINLRESRVRRSRRWRCACMAKLMDVSPVSNEDTRELPVKNLGPAVVYYESIMGFITISRDATTAVLRRDNAEIGLVVKSDHQPHEAGSLAFKVDDHDTLHRELKERDGK